MVAQIWADGGALTGLVNNAAGNFISRTKDLSPRGFNAIADIVFRGSFYVTLACGKRWIEGGNKASVISILTTWIWNGGPFTVPSRHVEGRPQHHDQVARDGVGPARHPPERDRAGTVPDQGRVGAAQSRGERRRHDAKARQTAGMARNGEMFELANLATFLMADGCEYLTGQTIAIDGGMHLAAGGNFARLAALGDSRMGSDPRPDSFRQRQGQGATQRVISKRFVRSYGHLLSN